MIDSQILTEREERHPDLCNKPVRGIYGAETFCSQPKEHGGKCDWRTAEEKQDAARPVMVRDWMDLFHFEPATEVFCPDCEAISPEVDNLFAAAKWVEKHEKECPA